MSNERMSCVPRGISTMKSTIWLNWMPESTSSSSHSRGAGRVSGAMTLDSESGAAANRPGHGDRSGAEAHECQAPGERARIAAGQIEHRAEDERGEEPRAETEHRVHRHGRAADALIDARDEARGQRGGIAHD